jgi:hypothetical protein
MLTDEQRAKLEALRAEYQDAPDEEYEEPATPDAPTTEVNDSGQPSAEDAPESIFSPRVDPWPIPALTNVQQAAAGIRPERDAPPPLCNPPVGVANWTNERVPIQKEVPYPPGMRERIEALRAQLGQLTVAPFPTNVTKGGPPPDLEQKIAAVRAQHAQQLLAKKVGVR